MPPPARAEVPRATGLSAPARREAWVEAALADAVRRAGAPLAPVVSGFALRVRAPLAPVVSGLARRVEGVLSGREAPVS